MDGATQTQLSRRLEQLNRIAIGILDLDLPAARARLHVVPEMQAGILQSPDERRKIRHPKHDTIPSTGLLLLTVRHRPGSRRVWTAEQNLHIAERDVGERRKLLVSEREAEMRRVERDRPGDVFDLISDTVHALDERVTSTALLLSYLVTRSCHLFFSWVLECSDHRDKRKNRSRAS